MDPPPAPRAVVVVVEAAQAAGLSIRGRNQLDERRLARAAGGSGRARRVDADRVRAVTGFAIGGVPPFGHRTALRCFIDRDLLDHDLVWASAGTPHAVFATSPRDLVRIAGGQVVELRKT